jgi:4-hydroxy 2-oxovalerate aldolase
MKAIKLLDCTLRDGGYLNNWKFGSIAIRDIINRLDKAGVDIIEIGFLDDERIFDKDCTVFPDIKSTNTVLINHVTTKAMVVVMIIYGQYQIEKIPPRKEVCLSGIRVAFKKHDMNNALSFCRKLKDFGYNVFIQPTSITSYSDIEMLYLINAVNKISPYVVSIVDTYGLLHKENLLKYFYLMDTNLSNDIKIGYHSHNNFQLAYSNSTELMNMNTKREIIIDATLYGMGYRAGNTNTELIGMYLNDNFNTNYDISELLEIIDINILKLREKYTWGYSFLNFISAFNDCHPEYVEYLKSKNMLSVKSINHILDKIEKDKKLLFDKEHIEQLYFNYQKVQIDDTTALNELEKELMGKNIVLMGPGNSIIVQKKEIVKYVDKNESIVISVNHIPSILNPAYVFMSNSKRYEQFMNTNLDKNNNNFKIIATSNIISMNNEFDYVLNYENLLCKNRMIHDAALLMALTVLDKIGIGNVGLAGFDGFSIHDEKDYYDDYFNFQRNNQGNKETNEAIAKHINEMKSRMTINFITDSLYEKI